MKGFSRAWASQWDVDEFLGLESDRSLLIERQVGVSCVPKAVTRRWSMKQAKRTRDWHQVRRYRPSRVPRLCVGTQLRLVVGR